MSDKLEIPAESNKPFCFLMTFLNCLSALRGSTVALLVLMSSVCFPITSVFSQSSTCEELICNGSLQFSLNDMCMGNFSADQFLENPQEGIDYDIRFFDVNNREVTDFSEEDLEDEFTYLISCSTNSCSGIVTIEANQFPDLDTPCALREDGTIPTDCIYWCSQLLPAELLSINEVSALFDNDCGPQLVGDLEEVSTFDGDICSPDGEIVTISYKGKFLLHGQIQIKNVLTQRFIRQKIDIGFLDDNQTKFIFPEDIELNCDQTPDPDSIALYTEDIIAAYPFYIDIHSLVPDSTERCDTFQVVEFLQHRDTTIQTTTPSGDIIWEKVTLVDKLFTDSIVCGFLPLLDIDNIPVTSPAEVALTKRFCNLLSSYSDVTFDACGSGTKIVRTWTILDWCDSSAELTGTQIIEVTDTEKPHIISEVTDLRASVDPWLCSAVIKLPEIIAEDNCGEVSIDYIIDEGTIADGYVKDLWLSQDSIPMLILVSDECENTDTISIHIHIEDITPPVVVCNAALQVALTASSYDIQEGVAKLLAIDFDEGSHDFDCGKVELTVVRKEDWQSAVQNCEGKIVGYEPQSCYAITEEVDLGYAGRRDCDYNGLNKKALVTQPTAFIKFCCEDVGKIIEVILIATDEAGNVSQCEADVIVQNKNGPQLICEDLAVSCLDDMREVGAPELIDGTVCAVGNANLRISSEQIDDSDCDLIQVTRNWYADGNANGEFDEGEPFCSQNVTVTQSIQNISLSCTAVTVPCTTALEDLSPPEIIANQYCACGESLIKIASSRRSTSSCMTDTLYVEWYIDFDENGLPDTDEPGCTQEVYLSDNAENTSLVCPAVSIDCDESLLLVDRPEIMSTADLCICTEDFLRISDETRTGGDCISDLVVREWYLDNNQNNIFDQGESSCVQNITIDFDQVSYSLNCDLITISCDDDINAVPLPSINETGSCDCDEPEFVLIDEQTESSFCSDIRVSRTYLLDVNGNGIEDADEPTCIQIIEIDNEVQDVLLTCRDGFIPCTEDISTYRLPTIDNPNECVCDGSELILSSQSMITDLCDGDVIIREWFVDIDMDNIQDDGEPACIQNLTVTINVSTDPNVTGAIAFTCTDQTATCMSDLDGLSAPTLVTDGFCNCDDLDVLLNSQSPLEGICSGDVVIREYFADVNGNGSIDTQEPICNQRINIEGDVSYTLSCETRTISCFSDIANIQPPEVMTQGLCDCEAPTLRVLETDQQSELCEGDTIRQQWYLDIDEDNVFDDGEPTCIQLAIIDGNPFMATLNCGVMNISCQDDLDDFLPVAMTNQGICTCPLDLDILMRDEVDMPDRCIGDTLSRSWFLDLNSNAIFDNNEPSCNQIFIIMFDEVLELSCTNYTALCTDDIPQDANPPTLQQAGNCTCEDTEVRLFEESGSPDRCGGDTLTRLWYADINQNLTLDEGEPSCHQMIFLQDVPAQISLTCNDEIISCTTAIGDIPMPTLDVDGSCGCMDFALTLLTDGASNDLCFGDSFARTWFVDTDGNGIANSGESTCMQTITIQADMSAMQLVCEDQFLQCTESIEALVAPSVIGNGICACADVFAEPVMSEVRPTLCEGDTLFQTWFVDLNNNDSFDASDLSCEQAVIIQTDTLLLADNFSLACTDISITCSASLSDTQNVPTINSTDLCGCMDIPVLVSQQSGGEDRCVGDVITREWYGDLNENGSLDSGEPLCNQLITITEEDQVDITLNCPDISISCSTPLDSIMRPEVIFGSACGCMDSDLTLLNDESIDGVCFGEVFTREWYVDLNQDLVFQAGEPSCIQNIAVQGDMNNMALSCPTLNVNCTDTLSLIPPPGINAGGICSCDQVDVELDDVSIDGSVCIGDTIIQTWYVDINENGIFDNDELSCDQLLILQADTSGISSDISLSCMDFTISCTDSLSSIMNVPTLSGSGLCDCSDGTVLLVQQTGGEDRCMGDVITREWYGDLNANMMLDAGEPVCNQMITIAEEVSDTSNIRLACDEIFVTCAINRDSIPMPDIIAESSCSCTDFSLTLLSDGSGGGICFGESFIRDWYIDINRDGTPQNDEPACTQRITVQGSMDDMAFLCEPVAVICTDTLANVPPPTLNINGLCTCNQVEVELATVSIDGSVCTGDTIIQVWFVDTNSNEEFDDTDLSCEQLLIIDTTTSIDFLCEQIPVSCDAIIGDIPAPAVMGIGFCNCSDIESFLVSDIEFNDDLCIGDVIEREWYLDIDRDEVQDASEPTCVQSLVVVGDNSEVNFSCDTFSVSCTFDPATLPIPSLDMMEDCVCSDFDILLVDDAQMQDFLCSGDTTRISYYVDLDASGTFNELTEPSCDHILTINDSIPAFDPMSIKWPQFFTGGSILGTNIICIEGEVLENQTFIQMGDAFTCMPEDLDSRPFWCESECGLVTYSQIQDTVETIDACFKLVNTYTVIDWCTYDPAITDTLDRGSDTFIAISDTAQGECLNCPETGPAIADTIYFIYDRVEIDGVYTFSQEINIEDDDPPVVTVMVDTVRVDLALLDTDGDCLASTDVTAEAMDVCNETETLPDMIQWTIRVVNTERDVIPDSIGRLVFTAAGASVTVSTREGSAQDTFTIIWTVRDACNTASVRETKVIFFDSSGTCMPAGEGSGLIAGQVRTDLGDNIQGAMVKINGIQADYPDSLNTNVAGRYAFTTNDMYYNYAVSVDKVDDYLNGVSTADLILMYHHIASVSTFKTPYEYLAADINNDQNISLADVVVLKKLILGKIPVLPGNSSWRFIAQDQSFFDESNPWPFIEQINIVDLSHDMRDQNFMGIKIGDLTGDVLPNEKSIAQIRSHEVKEFLVEDQLLSSGDPSRITVNARDIQDVKGFQIEFMIKDATISNIQGLGITISDHDYSIEGDKVFISYVNEGNYRFDGDLFEINFTPHQSEWLHDAISVASQVLDAEVYIGDEVESNQLALEVVSPALQTDAILYQNQPNPFVDLSVIEFYIPISAEVEFEFFNLSGQSLHRIKAQYVQGKHQISISRHELNHQGIIYCRMTFGSTISTMKMVSL